MRPACKTTVYVVCHNHERFIQTALESVLRQSTDDWELLIFDDRSTDRSRDIIERFRHHPRVQVFFTEGIGLPRICNQAIERARGRYLMRLDGDDVLDENILLVLGNALDRQPELGLVFPDYYLIDEFGSIISREWREKLYDANHALDEPPHGACTMMRLAMLKEIGGYREDLGGQDGLDIWVRIKENFRSANINIPLFSYRRHQGNLTGNVRRIVAARRQIKKDAARARLAAIRPITAVIPCRRHYDFVPDLWRQEIRGQSLLARALAHACQSDVVDRIVVACDNPEAEAVLAGFPDPRLHFFLRPPAETLGGYGLAPTLSRIVEPLPGAAQGVTLIHYVQAPFLTVGTLEEAIHTLVLNEADSCFGVEEVTNLLYRRSPHGLQAINRPGGMASDFGAIFREAPTALATRNRNFKTGSLFGPRLLGFVTLPEEGYFVNNATKLAIAGLLADPLGEPGDREWQMASSPIGRVADIS